MNDIGANLSYNSVFPVVNVNGTPVTDKANLQIMGNYILSHAGGSNFVQAAQATLAQAVVNAAQPNITSVGNLTSLTMAGNLNIAVGNLNISGGENGFVLQTDGEGNLSWTAQTGGGGNGSPGGANTQVQFNNSGAFGGNSGFTFDKVHGALASPMVDTAAVYHLAGTVIENADLSHGATAAVVIPPNGSTSVPVQVTNTYGNVAIAAGESSNTVSWLFDNTGTLTAPGNADFNGNTVTIGPGASELASQLANPTLVISDNGMAYIQAAINNVSDNGSADWAAYGHHGNDSAGWVDMGFASSFFNDPNYTITGPGDGYLIAQGYLPGQAPAIGGGNLVFATGENGTTKDIIFGTGGFLAENELARFDHTNSLFHLTRVGSAIKFQDGSVQNTAFTGISNTFSSITFTDVPSGASNTIQYGLGNLIAYNDGTIAIAEYNGTDYGAQGIRIDPGVEGGAGIEVPSVADSATGAVTTYNYQGGGVNVVASGNTWHFDSNGNLTLPSNSSSINYANGSPYGGSGNANTGAITFDASTIGSENNWPINIQPGHPTYTNPQWTFDPSGNLTLPSGGNLGYYGMGWTGLTNGDTGTPISIALLSANANYTGQFMGGVGIFPGTDASGCVFIETGNLANSASYQWVFNDAGVLSLPGDLTTSGNIHANVVNTTEVVNANTLNLNSSAGNVVINTASSTKTSNWFQLYGDFSTDNHDVAGASVIFDAGGNLFVTGTYFSPDTGNSVGYLQKMSSTGTKLWELAAPPGLSGDPSITATTGEVLGFDGAGNLHWLLNVSTGNNPGDTPSGWMVYKLNPADGSVIWNTLNTTSSYANDMTVDAGGQVFIGTSINATISSLNSDGSPSWSQTNTGYAISVINTGANVVIGQSDGIVAGFAYDSTQLWSTQVTNNNTDSTALTFDGTNFYVANDNLITKFSGSDNATILWQKQIVNSNRGWYTYWMEYSNGSLYLISTSHDGQASDQSFIITSINSNDGSLNWANSVEVGYDYVWYWFGHRDIAISQDGTNLAITGYAYPNGANSGKQVIAVLPTDGTGVGEVSGPFKYVTVPDLVVNTISNAGTGPGSFGTDPVGFATYTVPTSLVTPYSFTTEYFPWTNNWVFDRTGNVTVSGNISFPEYSNHGNGPVGLLTANGYPSMIAYGSGGHGGPELDWTDTNDLSPNNFYGNNQVLRHTMYINGSGLTVGINENEVAGNFSGSWNFDTTGNLYTPGSVIVHAQNGNLVLGDATASASPGLSSTTSLTLTANRNGNAQSFVFSNEGSLTTPGSAGDITMTNGNITGANNIVLANNITTTGSGGDITMTNGNITGANNIVLANNVTANTFVGTNANVEVIAGSYNWTFDTAGNLTFQDGTSNVELVADTETLIFDTTGNLTVPNNVIATGNVTANVFYGNAAGLTNIPASLLTTRVTNAGPGNNYIQTTDNFVGLNRNGQTTIQLVLPSTANIGQQFTIKETSGFTASFNLTTDDVANVKVDGQSNVVTTSKTYSSITLVVAAADGGSGKGYWITANY